MNMRDAKRLKPGAIVRESFYPDSMGHPIHGIVIGKKYVKERHAANILGGYKDERYDVVVHWTCKEAAIPRKRYADNNQRLQVRQQWELMVVSHAK
tara:strand:- start:101 stop:388 length:288 start_codon:yes stop_codon:yes gene_type:complete